MHVDVEGSDYQLGRKSELRRFRPYQVCHVFIYEILTYHVRHRISVCRLNERLEVAIME